jgi:hypothetical protein
MHMLILQREREREKHMTKSTCGLAFTDFDFHMFNLESHLFFSFYVGFKFWLTSYVCVFAFCMVCVCVCVSVCVCVCVCERVLCDVCVNPKPYTLIRTCV